MKTSRPSVESFSFAAFSGEVLARHRPEDVEREVMRLADPGAASRTLHWGRNYLYAATLERERGPLKVIVKQFRNEGLRARLRRRWRGSKAETSWRAALAMTAAGVATPEPVMLIESTSPEGPSLYVCREVEELVESRYLFRALAAGRERELFPDLDAEAVLRRMGELMRRLHDAGVVHRDASIGNLLIGPGDEPASPRVVLLDLGRARLAPRLSVWRRTRDLTRLPIRERRHERAFLDGYWAERRGGRWLKRLLFAVGVRAFLVRNRLKDIVRGPGRWLYAAAVPRRAHVHIPPPPAGARARDKVAWDYLSDQPHQHAGRWEQLREYLTDSSIHARAFGATLLALPGVLARYRRLRRELYAEPWTWGGVGVGLRPWPAAPERLLELVDDLGLRHVLLRLHPWEESHREEAALAAALAERGLEVTFALPQNRELVVDRQRWRAAIEEIAETFLPYGRHFQVGQAVNRSKWGIWNSHEYLELAAEAGAILRAHGDAVVMGPSVIDFELYATVALVNMRHGAAAFDALASLLYVDRRGAPENEQLGFDTVDKTLLLKAIALGARNCGPASWITEFNWPLREGPHSPAGRKVAVDEQAQADYLARFYLLSLGTGQVERAFWWQIIAKGYGLVDPAAGALRRRPAFHALAHLERRLAGARFLRPLPAPAGCHLRHFERDGDELVVAWSEGGALRARLPRPAASVAGRDGKRLATPPGRDVELGSAPVYYRLER